jgi:hypothetical protein
VNLSRGTGLLISGVDAVAREDNGDPDRTMNRAGVGRFGKATAKAHLEVAPPEVESGNEGIHAVGNRLQV